jgi:hypothetical protein
MFIVVTCGSGGGGGGDYDGKRLTERHVGSRSLVVTATRTSMGAARWLSLASYDGMVARVDVDSRLLLLRQQRRRLCALSLARWS